MNRAVALAFALLGVLAGVTNQLRNALPELLSYPSIRTLQFGFLVAGAVAFVVSTLAAVALGYWANRRVDLPDEYAPFGLVAGVAGGLGFLFGTAAVLATTFSGSVVNEPLYAAVNVSYNAVTKSISIGLFGLAGAAIAHFRDGA